MHDLIKARPELTFHLVALVAERAPRALKYELPDNVLAISHVHLQEMDQGIKNPRGLGKLFEDLYPALRNLQRSGGLQEVAEISRLLFAPCREGRACGAAELSGSLGGPVPGL